MWSAGRWAALGLGAAVLGSAVEVGRASFASDCTVGTENCQQCTIGVEPECQCERSDFVFWTDGGAFFRYEEALEDCAIDTALAGFTDQSFIDCVADDSTLGSFTDTCQFCFSELLKCSVQPQCLAICVDLDLRNNQACRDCVVENCEPTFQNCSGWTTTFCDEEICVPEESQIIPGLPNEAFFAIVAVLGVGTIGVAVFCVRKALVPVDDSLVLSEVDVGGSTAYQVPVAAIKVDPAMESYDPSLAPSSPGAPETLRSYSLGSKDGYEMDDFEEQPDI